MKFFQNLKLNQKFFLLIVVLLIGFTAIGLVYNSLLTAEEETLNRAQRIGELGKVVSSINIKVLTARRFEKDFLLLNKLELLEKFERTMTTARQYAVNLGDFLQSAEEKKLLDQLQVVLESYQTNFYTAAEDTVAVGLDKNGGIQGEVADVGKTLEELLQPTNNLVLMTALLTMRQFESDFLTQASEETMQRISREKVKFANALQKSKLQADMQMEITETMAGYQELLLELQKAVTRKMEQIGKVNASIGEMAPILEGMLKVRDNRLTENNTLAATERQENTMTFIATLVIAISAVSLLVLLLSRGISNSITRPIEHLHSVVKQISAGDFSVRAKLNTSDELGNLGNALDNLLDERVARLQEAEKENETLNESVIGLLQGVAQMSQRDLTVKVPVTEDVTGPVGDAINLLANETAKVLEGVQQISNSVADSSSAVKQHSDNVMKVAEVERQTVEKTAKELATAAKTMNQISLLSQHTSITADKAIKATQSALESVTNTVKGIDGIRETIRETEKRTKRLGERTQEITGTVNLINNIAERTHILALNASMHAASAGEAGRGFAVVADEVQRLAENAREATSQIGSLVGSIQMETTDTLSAMNTVISQVVEGTKLAQKAGEQMQDTQNSTTELVQSVQRIAVNAKRQATITERLHKQALEIKKNTDKTRINLAEQSEQTNKLTNLSQQLQESVGVFKLPSNEASEEVLDVDLAKVINIEASA